MDLNRIRYFSVLAGLKHVRKAADLLGMNPASLSKAIKVLEHEVGFKLLVPVGRGIEITDRGMKLYRQSRALLQEYNALQTAIKSKNEDSLRTIRMGSMEIFTTYFLCRLMSTESISQKLRVLYLTPGKMEEALKLREIDVGITYIRLPEEELTYLKVGEFRMRIFGHKSMTIKKFEDLPFAVPVNGVTTPSVSLESLDGWPNDQFPRQIKYELELLETALQFARSGKAVVFCPDFVADLHNSCLPNHLHLHSVAPPHGFKDKKLSIFIAHRKNDEESAFIRKLAKAVRTVT